MINWNVIGNNAAFILIIVWEAFWKGMALWKSAKNNEKKWFVAILVINTFGILPIFYLWHTKQLKGVLTDLSRFIPKKK